MAQKMGNFLKQKVDNALKKRGIYVRTTRNEPFLLNVGKTAHRRRALVSYITRGYTTPDFFSHTNGFESRAIVETLSKLGYNVDVIDYFNTTLTPQYEDYDVVFGFGEPFENSFLAADCRAFRIFYGTSCHPFFQNEQSIRRLRDVHENCGFWLEDSARIFDKTYAMSLNLSDAIFHKGNHFVKKTYEAHFKGVIKSIDTSSFQLHEIDFDSKNFDDARRHFIWFGSGGMLHKGLDLTLRAFEKRPDLTLHVCGNLAREPLFTQVFHRELYETPNVAVHDFVDIRSEKFVELLKTCAFLIFPSASEGGCAGQVNVMMNGGLIPILTENCGLNTEEFGLKIADLTVESVNDSLKKATDLDADELRERAKAAFDYAQKTHTLDRFRATIERQFREVLPKDTPQ